MQREARLQTSATLFNYGNRYATHPSDEKGRESVHAAVPFRSGSAEELSLLFALIFVTVSFHYVAHSFKYCSEQALKTCYFGMMLSALRSIVVTVSNVTETL